MCVCKFACTVYCKQYNPTTECVCKFACVYRVHLQIQCTLCTCDLCCVLYHIQRSWVGASKKQCEELLEFIRHLAEDDKEGVMAVKVNNNNIVYSLIQYVGCFKKDKCYNYYYDPLELYNTINNFETISIYDKIPTHCIQENGCNNLEKCLLNITKILSERNKTTQTKSNKYKYMYECIIWYNYKHKNTCEINSPGL